MREYGSRRDSLKNKKIYLFLVSWEINLLLLDNPYQPLLWLFGAQRVIWISSSFLHVIARLGVVFREYFCSYAIDV